MKRSYLFISIILGCTLLLVGCGSEVSYEKGFLEKDSPAFMEYMHYYMSANKGQFLFKRDNTNVYAKRNPNSDLMTINYYTYIDKQLQAYYKPLFQDDDPKVTLRKLREDAESKLHKPVKDVDKYNLPVITMEESNQLMIKTTDHEKIFDLPKLTKDFNEQVTDDIIFNLHAMNDEGFLVKMNDTSIEDSLNKDLALFVEKDLSDSSIAKTHGEGLQDKLSQKELKKYYDLFPKADTKGRFLKLFNSYEVFDMKAGKTRNVDDNDYLSKDGKYVYLNGKEDPLSDGPQQIQTIENYMEGNDTYEAAFNISFKKIAKELKFKADGVGVAKIVYFNEDFVVLSLNYNAPIVGDAGSTNVIIDLQDDKDNPTAHLIDLDL